MYLILILILRYILYKIGFRPPQNESSVSRIVHMVLSGLLAVFTIGVIISLYIGQPLPNYFGVFLVVLFVVGAFIEDIIREMLKT
jgi:cytochrome b561